VEAVDFRAGQNFGEAQVTVRPKPLGQCTYSRKADTGTVRGRCICQHEAETG